MNKFGKDLIESLAEASEHAEGKPQPVRVHVVRVPDVRAPRMSSTQRFRKLVQQHVAADAAFGEALLREGIDTMLAGDVDIGKAILRDYIKATLGFEKPQPFQRARLPAKARRAGAACEGGAWIGNG
jgi:hypothetical protein